MRPSRPPAFRALACALIAPVLLAGCSILDPDGRGLAGVFVHTQAPADTLVFRGDFTGERATVYVVETGGGSTEAHLVRTPFTYTAVAGTYEISLYCPPNALCAAGPHYRARIAEPELLLDPLTTASSEATRRFRRVFR